MIPLTGGILLSNELKGSALARVNAVYGDEQRSFAVRALRLRVHEFSSVSLPSPIVAEDGHAQSANQLRLPSAPARPACGRSPERSGGRQGSLAV